MARKVARRGGLLLKILAQAHLISSTVTPNNRDVPVQESLSQVREHSDDLTFLYTS
jgi:hypothetical protein